MVSLVVYNFELNIHFLQSPFVHPDLGTVRPCVRPSWFRCKRERARGGRWREGHLECNFLSFHWSSCGSEGNKEKKWRLIEFEWWKVKWRVTKKEWFLFAVLPPPFTWPLHFASSSSSSLWQFFFPYFFELWVASSWFLFVFFFLFLLALRSLSSSLSFILLCFTLSLSFNSVFVRASSTLPTLQWINKSQNTYCYFGFHLDFWWWWFWWWKSFHFDFASYWLCF